MEPPRNPMSQSRHLQQPAVASKVGDLLAGFVLVESDPWSLWTWTSAAWDLPCAKHRGPSRRHPCGLLDAVHHFWQGPSCTGHMRRACVPCLRTRSSPCRTRSPCGPASDVDHSYQCLSPSYCGTPKRPRSSTQHRCRREELLEQRNDHVHTHLVSKHLGALERNVEPSWDSYISSFRGLA